MRARVTDRGKQRTAYVPSERAGLQPVERDDTRGADRTPRTERVHRARSAPCGHAPYAKPHLPTPLRWGRHVNDLRDAQDRCVIGAEHRDRDGRPGHADAGRATGPRGRRRTPSRARRSCRGTGRRARLRSWRRSRVRARPRPRAVPVSIPARRAAHAPDVQRRPRACSGTPRMALPHVQPSRVLANPTFFGSLPPSPRRANASAIRVGARSLRS